MPSSTGILIAKEEILWYTPQAAKNEIGRICERNDDKMIRSPQNTRAAKIRSISGQ
jgi:hypothetical protein